MSKNRKNWILTFISGGLISAAVIVLTTPRSDDETKNMVAGRIDNIIRHAEIILEKVRTPAYLITEQTISMFQLQKYKPETAIISTPSINQIVRDQNKYLYSK